MCVFLEERVLCAPVAQQQPHTLNNNDSLARRVHQLLVYLISQQHNALLGAPVD